MNEFYVTNRDVIKNLALNTGTTATPVYTNMCTASEITLNQSFEEKTWYVYCDAIQRSINTGVAITLEGTMKLDINNVAIQKVLGNIHTLLEEGTISQFNNLQVQFDLLTGVNNAVLEYTTYQVNVKLTVESLGGPAESEGEFGFKMSINGKASSPSA
ncbi:MAG: hypothetical protein IKE89_03420 [Bacilli bacterium]|nr:hypothetical protein [Bacilli bacterium]